MTEADIARKIRKLEAENTRLAGLCHALNKRVRALHEQAMEELKAIEERLTWIERELPPEPKPL